jgi:deoxyribose-phosphate aldolase
VKKQDNEERTLAQYIDHTLLKPDCTSEEIEILCREALQHGFYSVCVTPYFVRHAKTILGKSAVKVATVIGFPMGYSPTSSKAEEIKRAFINGADEVDAVVNINAVKNKDWTYIRNDIDTMSRMASMRDKLLKVIFEVDLLTEDEAKKLCDICIETDVRYVKTATGVNGKGNQPKVVSFLREYLPKGIKVKASGGIRTKSEAEALIKAGADRLGCSRSVEIVNG